MKAGPLEGSTHVALESHPKGPSTQYEVIEPNRAQKEGLAGATRACYKVSMGPCLVAPLGYSIYLASHYNFETRSWPRL